jgi:hypothetical protein
MKKVFELIVKEIQSIHIERPIRILGFFFSMLSWPILVTAPLATNVGDTAVYLTALMIGITYFVLGAILIFLDYKFNNQTPTKKHV